MKHTLSIRSIVVAIKDQVFCDLGGETAILNLTNGVYYGLDPVGTRIWSLIQEARPVGAIRDVLCSEFEVDLERCERDLLTLLQALAAERLIEVQAR